MFQNITQIIKKKKLFFQEFQIEKDRTILHYKHNQHY